MVGWSAGGGYALACAAGMPERISAVGLASCEGPYDEVPGALEEGMTPEERTLFERIRRDPAAAHGAVADHVGWYQDPDTIWEWEPPAVDVPILARTDVRDALTQMFREGARQGVDGLVADCIAPSLPWGFAFADLKLAQLQASAVPPGRASAVAAALGRDPCRGDSLSSPLTSGGSRGRSGVAADRGFKAIGGGGEAAVAETNGFGQLPVPRRALPGPITTAMLLAPCG